MVMGIVACGPIENTSWRGTTRLWAIDFDRRVECSNANGTLGKDRPDEKETRCYLIDSETYSREKSDNRM